MKLKTTLFSLFLAASATAQVTPTLLNELSGYEGLADMVWYNNAVYISNPEEGHILKVSTTTADAAEEIWISGLSFPTGLAVVGSDLYFLEGANGTMTPNSGRLRKISLSNPISPVDIIGGLSFPLELEVSGTKAYVVEGYIDGSFDLDHTEVSLVDFTATPAKTVLNDDFYSLDDIELHGTDLYLLEWNGEEEIGATTIQKLNVAAGTPGTPTLVYEDEGLFPYKMEIYGDMMYLNMDGDVSPAVFGLDLTDATPELTQVAVPFEVEGEGVYIEEIFVTTGNMMYTLGSYFDGEEDHYGLFRADLSSMGVSDPALRTISVYPNPVTDALTVDGLQASVPYAIHDAFGRKVAAAQVGISGSIDATALSAGTYILIVEGCKPVKLLKK